MEPLRLVRPGLLSVIWCQEGLEKIKELWLSSAKKVHLHSITWVQVLSQLRSFRTTAQRWSPSGVRCKGPIHGRDPEISEPFFRCLVLTAGMLRDQGPTWRIAATMWPPQAPKRGTSSLKASDVGACQVCLCRLFWSMARPSFLVSKRSRTLGLRC